MITALPHIDTGDQLAAVKNPIGSSGWTVLHQVATDPKLVELILSIL